MPDNPSLQVRGPTDRIDKTPVFAQRHSVDRKIAMPQVLLKRGAKTKAPLAIAGQGVLLSGFRVQEHRELAPNLTETQGQHPVWSGAHHHPIPIPRRAFQKQITNITANKIAPHLHPPSV